MIRRLVAALALVCAMPAAAKPVNWPTRFDDIGPAVQTLTAPSGRTVHYADTGEAGWRPVLYIGGTGTSARAMLMTGYLDSLRRRLKIRLISVERNGFGDTAYDPAWGLADYPDEVRAVLDHLTIKTFAIVAISGGGPYAAHVAAAMPDRIASLHFAAALADVMPDAAPRCAMTVDTLAKAMAPTLDDPRRWWAFPAGSSTARIPGFADRARDEGARAFFIAGQMGDARAEAAEMLRYCHAHLDDLGLARIKAPVFTYNGLADPLVVPANAARWHALLPGPATTRTWPGEAHDVQYRHWDQILVDIAGLSGTGPAARTLVCIRGKVDLVRKVPAGAKAGLCLWR